MIKSLRHYRHVVEEPDRHGNVRCYFRVGQGLRTRIRATPGTEEFDRTYHDLMRRWATGELKPAPRDTPKPGTVRWLGTQWVTSTEFRQLDPRTQHVTRLILDSIYREPIAPGANEVFGDCPIGRFNVKAIGILVDRKAATPEAANNRLKRLRAMFRWAMLPKSAHLGVTANPARDVPKLKPKRKGGFPTWRPADLDRFEAHHPIGSQARLALALIMLTGASRSDVVRLAWPMFHNGVLGFTRWKGRNRNPVDVHLQLIPELRSIIEQTPVIGATTWLVTQYGRPFTANGFGNKFKEWCEQAGVRTPERQLSAHGVRKAAATRMADRRASASTLMASFGWLDIKQAELYTREADRKRLGAPTRNKRWRKIPHLGRSDIPGEGKKRSKKVRNFNGQLQGWCPRRDRDN